MEPKVEFDLLKLKNNITNLKKQTKGINFLFPVKCCNHHIVLDIIEILKSKMILIIPRFL